jgi:hypothetical protein
MNDRLVRVYDRDFLQSRRGVGLADPAPIFHPRAAALGIDAAGADTRQPQQVEGTSEYPT